MQDYKATQVKTIQQGKAVIADHGYMLREGKDIVAFYVDAWGETGRAFPAMTGSSYDQETKLWNPSVYFQADYEDVENELTEVTFPGYEGWTVFSVTGGKTASVCLVKYE